MPDPSYPCNRHFVAAGRRARRGCCPPRPARASSSTPPRSRRALDARPRAACCWPRRPTPPARRSRPTRWRAIVAGRARARRRHDRRRDLPRPELRRGLRPQRAGPGRGHHLDQQLQQVLRHDRLAPGLDGAAATTWCAPVEKLAQNLYICAVARIAQHAALACFEPDSIAEYERRRTEFRAPARLHRAGAERLGLPVPVPPDGAFYAWADCSALAARAGTSAFDMMHRAHVALTPGRDFGPALADRYLRLSFASAMPKLQAAVAQLGRVLGNGA